MGLLALKTARNYSNNVIPGSAGRTGAAIA